MADIQTVADRLEDATIKAENAADTLDAIVEGDVNTEVVSDGGRTLPSIEKWYNDNFAVLTTTLNNQVTIATTKATEAAASALESKNWANYAEDSLVPEGNNVDEYSAKHHRNKADDAQTASESARDTAIQEASDAADSATEAQNWANSNEDVLVPEGNQVDEYSAKHHAIKSSDSATESKNWANYAEDTLVPEGNLSDEYSAKHHRNKAEDAQAVCEAIQASLAQGINYGGDWSAVSGTTPVNPAEGSELYRISAAGTINGDQLDIDDLLYYDQDNDTWKGIKNGYNVLLSELGGYASTGGTISGKVTVEDAADGKLELRVPSGNGDEWNYIEFIGSNGARDTYIGTNASGNPIWNMDGGVSLLLTTTNLEIDGQQVWHEGNFDPEVFSTNPTYNGILSFTSDEESTIKGTIERVQDNGDTASASSYKTIMINGGEHVNGTAYTNWRVYNSGIDAHGIILGNNGLYYAVANASTNNQTVNATEYKIWHENNDGSGSGLDADLLDGKQASEFAELNSLNTFTNETYFTIPTTAVTGGSYWAYRTPASNGDFNIAWYNGSSYDFNREIRYDWTDNRWEISGGLELKAGDLQIESGVDINFTGAAGIYSNGIELLRDNDNGNVNLNANTGGLYLGYRTTTDMYFYTGDGAAVEAERGRIYGSNGRFRYDYDFDLTDKAYFGATTNNFYQNLDMNGNVITDVARLHNASSIILRPAGTGTNKFTFNLNDLTTSSGVDLNIGGNIQQTEDSTNNFAGAIKAKTFAIEHNGSAGYIASPDGAFFQSTSSSLTGAIKISLPTHGTSDMLSFYVDIFNYSTNESFTLHISGYLYQTTGNYEWVNLSVANLASETSRDFTVRFGADGSNNCLWIGETSSTWKYLQVVVRDFYSAYTTNIDNYLSGWTISLETSFDTVDDIHSNNLPATDWNKIKNLPSTFTPSSHNHDASDIVSGTLSDSRLPDSQSAKTFSGNSTFYSTDTTGNYSSAGIELRETNQVGSSQSADAYAPAFTLHWENVAQQQIALHSDGAIHFRDGITHSTDTEVHAGSYVASEYKFSDNSPTISENGNYVRIQTSTGWLDMGSDSSSYAHFRTDRPEFYFGTDVRVNGDVTPYSDSSYTVGLSGRRFYGGFFDELDVRRGVNGSYGTSAGTGSNWGSTIWGMGPSFDGSDSGSTYDKSSVYGISWLRGSHASALSQVGEGLYVYQNGSFQAGLGASGFRVDGNADINGNISVSGTVDGRDVATDGAKLDGISSGANNYTHPTFNGDDFSIDTGQLNGATVISDLDINITTNSEGHVVDANATVNTRNLAASDIGALGVGDTASNSNALGGVTLQSSGNNFDVVPYVSSGGFTYIGSNLRFYASDTDTSYNWGMQLGGGSDQHMYFSNGSTIRYEFLTDGTFRSDGDQVAYYSDERLKNIDSELTNCMDALNSWKVIRYQATKHAEEISKGAFKSDKWEIGLSAQDVQKTHPECVEFAPFDRDENNESISGEDYLTLKYERTVPVLVGAIKEKDEEISRLNGRVDKLESMIKELLGKEL